MFLLTCLDHVLALGADGPHATVHIQRVLIAKPLQLAVDDNEGPGATDARAERDGGVIVIIVNVVERTQLLIQEKVHSSQISIIPNHKINQ
jgi:hypothetical protein